MFDHFFTFDLFAAKTGYSARKFNISRNESYGIIKYN